MAGGRPCCDVTPDEARRVWDSVAKSGLPVSSAMVARMFTAAGRPVTQRAVHEWKKRGWKVGRSRADTNSAQILRETLETGAALISGDPETRIADLIPEMDGAVITYPLPTQAWLEKARSLSLEDLITEAAKAHLVAWYAVMKTVSENPKKYLDTSIEGVARLFDSEGGNAAAGMLTAAGSLRDKAMKLDDAMRDVTSRADEVPPPADDPMLIELMAFRRGGTAGVAAVVKR